MQSLDREAIAQGRATKVKGRAEARVLPSQGVIFFTYKSEIMMTTKLKLRTVWSSSRLAGTWCGNYRTAQDFFILNLLACRYFFCPWTAKNVADCWQNDVFDVCMCVNRLVQQVDVLAENDVTERRECETAITHI